MTRKLHGFAGLLTAISVAVIPFSASPVPTTAADDGTLYGVVGCPFCGSSVDRVDPVAGTHTQVAALGTDRYDAMAVDPTSHLLYVASVVSIHERHIITIDSQTGAMTVSPNLDHSLVSLVFDPTTHTLYGLTVFTLLPIGLGSEVVSVDPVTGVETDIAGIRGFVGSLTLNPVTQTLYTSGDFGTPFPTGHLFAIDIHTGAVSATLLSPIAWDLIYDPAAGALFGIASSNPIAFVRVDAGTGIETPVGNFAFPPTFPGAPTIDPQSHMIFMVSNESTGSGWVGHVITINVLTGSGTVSPGISQALTALAFQPSPITPESIEADVRAALGSGAIDNAGVANSLLAKLNAAADARSRGQCSVAAAIYGAFIDDLNAQSGNHVAADAATRLVAEAQFLVANCP
jgi:hypothetical protein